MDGRCGNEFYQILADMKPYVLRLPHKAERQRCALWIKKLNELPLTSDECKSRDLHAKLLLHMIKRGIIDGPFAVKPDEGPLKKLPTYMSVFFENCGSDIPQCEEEISMHNPRSAQAKLPDWVLQEMDDAGLAIFRSKENIDPYIEAQVDAPDFQRSNLSRSDGSIHLEKCVRDYSKQWQQRHMDMSSVFRDEPSLVRMHEKELEMNTKVLQAQFHEEKLKLQHKHDKAVQKILDRKNREIDEFKQQFGKREKDLEEAMLKSDKRAEDMMKELQLQRDTKEKQVDELKGILQETSETVRAEYECQLEEAVGAFEHEKYELQKTHTKKIQELLDDTNQRLVKMEEEYNAQTAATKMVIGELEIRVSQLTQETESLSTSKHSLQSEKDHAERMLASTEKKVAQIEEKCTSLEKELKSTRHNHELQMKSLLNNHDANTELLKQENTHFLNRAQETARDLENQIQSLKHALQDSEQQRMRELRERESLHQQDITRLQRLHEKQIHQLQCEYDQDKAHHAKEIRNFENVIHDRDDQITKFTAQQRQTAEEAEKAFENYKQQMNDTQQKIFSDMQTQLSKLGNDLENSRNQTGKLKKEFNAQTDELKLKHQDEVIEMKAKYEQDKASIMQQAIADRDELVAAHEKQLVEMEQKMKLTLEENEKIVEERNIHHTESIASMEAQIVELREELVAANALRRQQLVELGLLREEERQKASREHDAVVSKLEAEIDCQRLAMHQQHASELDRQSLRTKSRLDSLEKDYQQRLERAYDRISELQEKENSLRGEIGKMQTECEQQIAENIARKDDDTKRLRLKFESENSALVAEVQSERDKCHSLHRQLQKVEFGMKDKMTTVRMEYEEKIRGLLPASLKQDLEDTIKCLRSQVSSLQQRIAILQEADDDGQICHVPVSAAHRLTATDLS